MRALLAVLLASLLASTAAAQQSVPPVPQAAVDALLACERAEHAGWVHGMRVLDERYTLGTRTQLFAAARVVDTATTACTIAAGALAPVRPELAQVLTECVRTRSRAKTDSLAGNATVSDLLEAMREVCSLDAVRELDGDSPPPPRAADLHRIAATRFLRGSYEALQAAINRAGSDQYQYQVELDDLRHGGSAADRRTATAGRDAAQRTVTRLRSARSRFAAAIERWRHGGAAPAAIAAALTGGLDAEDVAALQSDLAR